MPDPTMDAATEAVMNASQRWMMFKPLELPDRVDRSRWVVAIMQGEKEVLAAVVVTREDLLEMATAIARKAGDA